MPQPAAPLKPFIPLRKRLIQLLSYVVAAALVIVFGFFAFPELLSFWIGMTVLAVVLAGYALVIFTRQGYYDFQRIQSMDDWSKLEAEEFEHLTAEIYRRLGYRVNVEGGGVGKTALIVAHKSMQTTIIRINPKREPVGPAELDVLQKVRLSRRARGAVLISRHGFTSSCTEQARSHQIELLEGRQLYRTLQTLSPSLKDKKKTK